MSTSEPSTQSAAERKAADAELRKLIAKFTPTRVRLVGAVRKALQDRLPTAHEVVYEYRDCFVIGFSPNEHGYEAVLALRGSEEGVKLYFNQGKELADPAKLLRGSGKQVRWIDVDRASTLTSPEVASLIEQALAHNQVPYAPTGRGAVIIRATTARKGGASRSE